MSLFWLVTAAMAAAAVAFVLVPLLRPRAARGPSESQANLEVLRGHRREIEADIAAGTLPADAREEALADLVGRAADDLVEPARREHPAAGPWPIAAAVAVALPVLAFGIYIAIGSPGALDARSRSAAGDPRIDAQQIAAMVESLAAKMKERPDDPKGLALLARSMASLERFQESADAYARLIKLVPPDAALLADYADVLAMAQGRKLAGRPSELIREALRLDPRHPKALALAGSAAEEAGELAASIGYWQALAAQLEPGSPDAREVDQIIDELRARTRAGPLAGLPAIAPDRAAVAASGAVSGSVSLAPEIKARLKGDETVFIFARAEGSGPRAPLAVIRASARELPMRFALDDSQAMAPGMTISSAASMRIEARVSQSGDAMPRSGDFVGASAVVRPGARDVTVLVDKVLP